MSSTAGNTGDPVTVTVDLEAEEEEVFLDCGASPELRRSTRTSARKRSSTARSTERPKSKREKKMSVSRTPVGQKNGGAAPVQTPTGPPPDPKPGDPDPFFAKMQAMLTGMEGRLNKATENLQTSVTSEIGDLKERMSKNEDKIDNIYSEVSSMVQSKIEEGLRKLTQTEESMAGSCPTGASSSSLTSDSSLTYASALASLPPSGGPSFRSMDRKELDYMRARKSLRLRPVSGKADRASAVAFMQKYLKIDSGTIDRLGDFSVAAVPFGQKAKYKEEILVAFPTVEARDVVRSAASNLAGLGSDYGVRLEVPNHLRSSMRALQAISFEIKTKHVGSRRNVLYDDDSMQLVLDFSLGEGKPWRRVTAVQAMAKKRNEPEAKSTVDDRELDDILGRGDDHEEHRPARNRLGFGGDSFEA